MPGAAVPSHPSGGSGPRLARLELAPLRGVRYVPGRVSALAEVTSPPYDVIAPGGESQLMAADPHNVVRLILPRRSPGHAGSPYREAAELLRQWLAEGILAADPAPALYVYEQAAGGEVVQRGLIGALRLSPPGDGVVLPHEEVAPGPVAGRLALMEATEANLEPIFLLYDGDWQRQAGQAATNADLPGRAAMAVVPGDHADRGDGAAARAIAAAARTGPLLQATTADGLRHRLWAITDPGELGAIAADLAPRQALIADGHHRYAAYLELQRRRAADGPGPWDYGLALLVDSAAYPPRIGAIHRVIPGLDPATAAERAKAAFRVSPVPGGVWPGVTTPTGSDRPAAGTGSDRQAAGAGSDRHAEHARGSLEAALRLLAQASRSGPAYLVAGGGAGYLLTDPDPVQADAAMPPGHSPRWRSLAASVLQVLLLGRLWGLADAEPGVRIAHDAGDALRAASGATAGTAVICPPMTAGDVYAIAAAGERVPRKSTSFGPKPRTGLVLRLFAEG